MILVNDPGSWSHIYRPLAHADWHGVTLADLVFPFFLFIVGVSITLSLSKAKARGDDRAALRRKILLRSAKIFALGLVLGLMPLFDLSDIRLLGVLQRIALVYLVCALLFLYGNRWLEMIAFIFLLVGYWHAMLLVSVPGYGAGDLLPAHNFANWVDSQFLPGKLWRGTWDPEGLFSTLPAIASGISGLMIGRLLLSDRLLISKISWLAFAGIAMLSVALEWSSAPWDMAFPLNKQLWTSSYVLYTSGWACILLAGLVLLIDMKGVRKPFGFAIIFGSNAITLYALSQVLMFTLDHGLGVQEASFQALLGLGLLPKDASLVWATGFTAFCFVPALILYRRKIFIKL